MAAGSLLQQGVGAGAVEALVISTLLYMVPSNYSEALRDDVVRGGRPVVPPLPEHIEQHLAEPIGLFEDLAACTSLSPRSIQVGFREDLHTTPTAYIRDQRLARAPHPAVGPARRRGDGHRGRPTLGVRPPREVLRALPQHVRRAALADPAGRWSTTMHELSLCQSMVGIVERARDGRPVRMGPGADQELRQVVPETLEYCWGIVTRDSALDTGRCSRSSGACPLDWPRLRGPRPR